SGDQERPWRHRDCARAQARAGAHCLTPAPVGTAGGRGTSRPQRLDVPVDVLPSAGLRQARLLPLRSGRPGRSNTTTSWPGLARRLVKHDLAHIRGIDRGPAESAQEDLGATVLGLADDLAACPEALVAKPRRRDADAVDIACGQSDRTRQPDIERIQVRALAAEIAGLEHRGDVADAAAARLRIAEGIIDDPLVDATRLLDVAECPAHDPVSGRL